MSVLRLHNDENLRPPDYELNRRGFHSGSGLRSAHAAMKIALLCSGLGHVVRGHEVFARGLFDLLSPHAELTLFKGGGSTAAREVVVPCAHRYDPCLDHIHVPASSRWADSLREEERHRIEHETFAYGAIPFLLQGEFDIVHALEQEVCRIVWSNRHLFTQVPRVVFSNGGALPAADLPPCDAVQEHTPYNLRFSDPRRAFMIPHGVDVDRFRPGLSSGFRERYGIPADVILALSVGTICVNHKRMDHVIRELSPLIDVHLAIVGQESGESEAIRALGQSLMPGRITFTQMAHDELPTAYAAADFFVLGSLFETFGIVYIEAMAAGLPVVCTNHPNQRGIVQEGGLFVDMSRPGELNRAMRDANPQALASLGRRGRQIAEREYDLRVLAARYMQHYDLLTARPVSIPESTLGERLYANLRNAWRRALRAAQGRAH